MTTQLEIPDTERIKPAPLPHKEKATDSRTIMVTCASPTREKVATRSVVLSGLNSKGTRTDFTAHFNKLGLSLALQYLFADRLTLRTRLGLWLIGKDLQ